MTSLVVSAHTMKLRFPEFAAVDNAAIEFAIEEANLGVDATWPASHANLGIMYLSAHYLMVYLSRQESGTGQQIKSESFAGVMSITYAEQAQPLTDADTDDLKTTPYGVRYLEMLNRLFTGPLVV